VEKGCVRGEDGLGFGLWGEEVDILDGDGKSDLVRSLGEELKMNLHGGLIVAFVS
jgi:hypothetical protein